MEREVDVQIGAAAAVICYCFGQFDLLANLYSYPHLWSCPNDARYRWLK